MENLKRVRGRSGGFGYRNSSQEKYSLTGVGVLCTYIWKQEKDMVVRDGIEYMMEHTRKEYPIEYKHERADLYAWYYNTLACAFVGGPAWQKWNGALQDQLLRNQDADGSWPPLAGKSAGGEFQRNPEMLGKLYRTTLCTLMLEVYYRYTPSEK